MKPVLLFHLAEDEAAARAFAAAAGGVASPPVQACRVDSLDALLEALADERAACAFVAAGRLCADPGEAARRIVTAARGRPVIVCGAPRDADVEHALCEAGVHERLTSPLPDAVAIARAARYGALFMAVFEHLGADAARYRDFFINDLTADYVTTPEGRIIDCNPEFVRMFGFESREQVLRTRPEAMYPNPAARVALMDRLRAEGRLERMELELRRVDGTPIHAIENMVGQFDAHGTLIGVYGYLFDITERVGLERRLAQAHKMEAIGRLAGGVAHDFNNLLTVILGQSQSLAADEGLSPALAAGLADITAAAERAAALTRQLLAFSRGQVLEREVLDLNTLIRGAAGVLERLLPAGVRLDIGCGEGLWPIEANPGQIEQVLWNLVVNARDAMPDGGTITIRTCNVESAAGNAVRLRVSDTGIGISRSDASRVFDPFFTTKETGKGTGLGLSMVYSIVQQAGGRITLASDDGPGAAFEIDLPRSQGRLRPRAPEARGAERRRGRGRKVMVVDDEPAVRRLVAEMLTRAGYEVVVAASGQEALDCLARHADVALLITDVAMQGIDGLDLARRARDTRPDLAVLYMTGYGEGAVVATGEQRTEMILKPFGIEALDRKIDAALATG